MKTFQEFMVIAEGMTMDDFKKQRRRQKEEPPIRKRGGISAPEGERSIGGQPNRDNKDYWASVIGKNRDRGAGNKAKRRAAALNTEEVEIEEGMTLKDFKANRRKNKRREASADAKKRGHVGKEWYNSGRTYSPDEAKSGRANMPDHERSTRHRSALDPEGEDSNYSADRTKNPKKLRKQKAMGEIPKESFEPISELNRYEKETGKDFKTGKPSVKGGTAAGDKAYQHVVHNVLRKMQGRPQGQQKKVKGQKPPTAGQYGGPASPAQKLAMRKRAAQQARDNQSSRFD